MEQRKLGTGGLEVSSIGLGCMGMSEFYGPSDEAKSLATLNHALDNKMSFWDTSDMYGSGHNERLLSRVLKDRRDEIVLATAASTTWPKTTGDAATRASRARTSTATSGSPTAFASWRRRENAPPLSWPWRG